MPACVDVRQLHNQDRVSDSLMLAINITALRFVVTVEVVEPAIVDISAYIKNVLDFNESSC